MDKYIFNIIIVAAGTGFIYIFEDWNKALMALICFMIIDYLIGLLGSYIQENLNSKIGFEGILRKCIILIVLIMGVLLNKLLNNGTWVFRTLIAYF